ncbi:MAG: hypothetical protein NZZ41_06895, partial [Candidatus Dojkabacteria bacterium]|nr:hypothetical protein [Candidatus Dojkabacteria bacterium]
MIINGFVFNSAMLSGYQCVTFKFSETPSVVALDGYVHIRGDIKSAGALFAQISSIAPAGLILGVYENTYPVKEGYFYIQDRRVTVNNYSIVSNVLKDQTTIVSIKLPNNFRLYKGTTPVNVWAYPTEDYIFIVRREAATQTEFDSEILTLNNYPIG